MTDHPAPPVAALKPYSYERHGLMIEDPYHWLRDPKYPIVDDPEILAHLKAENDYFRTVMQPLEPLVETLLAEMKGRIKEDDSSVPVEENGYLYQWRFEKGAQYRKWYRRAVAGGSEELLLDEPALAAGKDYFRLGAFSISPDGKLLAYSADDSGAERFTLYVKDLATGAMMPIEISETVGQPAWSADSRVLVYTVVNQAWRPYQIKAHVLGSAVADDKILYEETDEGFRVSVGKSHSQEVIFLLTGDHVTSEIRFIPTADPFSAQRLIARREPGREYHVDHGGGALYVRVNDTHKNFRIVRASLEAPESANWVELVAGSEERYIRRLTAFERFLVLEERHAGLDQVILRTPDGAEVAVEFPEAAYQAKLGDTPALDPAAIRLEYSSMATPATTYEFDVATRRLKVLKVQEIPSGYDPADYVTERLMAPTRDGVLVPISLVYRKGWTKGQGEPLHLYGYGAYGLGISPSFSSARISLLDRGFVYAIAHIRGGDEFGYGWYEAGKLERRRNTFNDFIDAARFLERQGYAAPGGVSASGASAGGQLMGVIVNEAPELWRAVVAHVPFVDALNTMQDATLPLTPPEWPEWGNPITDKAAFDQIRSYSPYDNVEARDYPRLMITAGLNDPRVTYWEPAKWAAKLRALKTDSNVLVSKTNMGAGHGGKSGRFDRLTEVAEEFAFVIDAFKH